MSRQVNTSTVGGLAAYIFGFFGAVCRLFGKLTVKQKCSESVAHGTDTTGAVGLEKIAFFSTFGAYRINFAFGIIFPAEVLSLLFVLSRLRTV